MRALSAGHPSPLPWLRDPVVWVGAALGAASSAWAFFAGRYLPYIDWSNHLALISALAHGGENGSLDYLTRSLAPSPYLFFYVVAASIAQVVAVDVAAKIALVISAAALVLGAANLADATGRSPRLGLIAPLAQFGISLGMGFGSFVFGLPVVLFAVASLERYLAATDRASRRRAGIVCAIWIVLAFLAHAFLFVCALMLIALRALLAVAAARSARPLLAIALVLAPAFLVAAPPVIARMVDPWHEVGAAPEPAAAEILTLAPLSERKEQYGGHLIERGAEVYWDIMKTALAVLAAWFAWSLFRGHPRDETAPRAPGGSLAMELYASALVLLYLFGPVSIGWPMGVWLVYPRFATLAALSLFLLPRCDLRGKIGVPLALCALIPVGWNAKVHAGQVALVSSWAAPYDQVREAVPPKTRVLALTVVGGGDIANAHPTMTSLYFYHMVDGASYVAFLFDTPGHPVRIRADRKPRQPFWRTPWELDPRTHGKDFDYLVLRGEGLVKRTVEAGEHELVREISGWHVFKTKNPTPRPSD